MANNTLAAIRARLQASDNKSNNKNKFSDNALFPFWNMGTGENARTRFLPDGDPKNDFFWVEKQVIKLPFPGIKGKDENKQIIIQVPCVEMFSKEEYPQGCPVLREVRSWYKSDDESLKEMASKYWKKKSYLMQGFVRDSSLKEESTPENPIRRFVLGQQLFNIIKMALLNPEIENLPTDYDMGRDFIINKAQKAGTKYSDYSTSAYSMKESPLTAAERAAIDQYGLSNLAEFLPKKPTDIDLKIIKEMFEASVDGQLYDPSKWNSYRPFGFGGNDSEAQNSEPEVKVNHKVSEKKEEPITQSADSTSKTRAQDILAKIQSRNRQ